MVIRSPLIRLQHRDKRYDLQAHQVTVDSLRLFHVSSMLMWINALYTSMMPAGLSVPDRINFSYRHRCAAACKVPPYYMIISTLMG